VRDATAGGTMGGRNRCRSRIWPSGSHSPSATCRKSRERKESHPADVTHDHPPVGHFLKPGRNRLDIEVTNLSANQIRDLDRRKVEWRIFHDINLVNHNYQRSDASKRPLTPSGLLGPVKLVPVKLMQAKVAARLAAGAKASAAQGRLQRKESKIAKVYNRYLVW